jgi:hemolysin-activating ACP:hemolysin acyltransferase
MPTVKRGFGFAAFSSLNTASTQSGQTLWMMKAIAPANNARQHFAFTAIKRFRQGGHHVQIERFRVRTRLFGTVENGNDRALSGSAESSV